MSAHVGKYKDGSDAVPPLVLVRLGAMPLRPQSARTPTHIPSRPSGGVRPATARPSTATTSSSSHGDRPSPYRMTPTRPTSSRVTPSRVHSARTSRPADSVQPASPKSFFDASIAAEESAATQGPPLTPAQARELAKKLINKLEKGNHIERENAVKGLWELCYTKQVGRVWLAEQASLVSCVAQLITFGTKGQKDGCSGLLCLLCDTTDAAKRNVADVPGVLAACCSLLDGSSDTQKVNGASAIWFLAVDDHNRRRLGQIPRIFDKLVGLVDQGTEHQKEQACGALRMLAHQMDANLVEMMQVASTPTALVAAASSGTYAALIQTLALLAELTRPRQGPDVHHDLRRRFRSQALGTQRAIDILVNVLELGTPEVRIQAAICLRNAFIRPSCFDLNKLRKGIVSRIRCVVMETSGGVQQKHLFDVLRAISHDDSKRREVGSEVGVFSVISVALSRHADQGLTHSALTLLKLLSQNRDNCMTASRQPSVLLALVDTLCAASQEDGELASLLTKCITTVGCLAVLEDNRRIMSQTSALVEVLGQTLRSCPHLCKQVLGALCNLVLHDAAATQVWEGGWLTTVTRLLRSEDYWVQLLAARTIQHTAQHDACSQQLGGHVKTIEELIWCSRKGSKDAGLACCLALAGLSSHHDSASIMAEIEHDEAFRCMHSLILRFREDAEEAEAGLWGLSNILSCHQDSRHKARQVISLLDSVGDTLTSDVAGVLEAGANAVKTLTVADEVNSEMLGKIPGLISNLCRLVEGGTKVQKSNAIGALCNLTATCERNRLAESFCETLFKAVVDCLAFEDDDVRMCTAGLICNLSAVSGKTDSLVKIGSQPLLFERLLQMVYDGEGDVRSNALGALCNLAKSDVNKFKIGNVAGALARLNSLTDLQPEDRARVCTLVFYASLSFSANREFGEQPDALKKLVETACSANAQDAEMESALAAISILACNKQNAQLNLHGLMSDLLPTLLRLLEKGSLPQKVNSMVCMWNAAASCSETKNLVGGQPRLVSLLVSIMRDGETRGGPAKLNAAGLLSELLNGSKRNGMLFAKTPNGLECVLEMSRGQGKGSLNACNVVVNFALACDERLGRVVEIEGGLRPIIRVLGEGNAEQKEMSLTLMASRVLRSQAGRRKLMRQKKLIPLLLQHLDWHGACGGKGGPLRLAELSAEALSNLSSGHEARIELSKVSEILVTLESVLADEDCSHILRYHATMCVASLCLDATMSRAAGRMKNLMLAFSASLCDESDHDPSLSLNAAAAAAYHNMAATYQENRSGICKDFRVVTRLVALSGSQDPGSMNAVGTIYEISKESGEIRAELMHQQDLVAALTKAMQEGSDRQKELACSALAILGEQDDFGGKDAANDLINLNLSVQDGAFECLMDLVLSGSPQQATPATAILGNLLVGSGAFFKGMLAETKGFLSKIFRQVRTAAPLQRGLSLRLLYHLMQGDPYLVSLVANEHGMIKVLCEMLEGGTNTQRRYACLCLRELTVHDEKMIDRIGEYNAGRVFKSCLLLFDERDDYLSRAAVMMLASLTKSAGNRGRAIKLERLVLGVCDMIMVKCASHYLTAARVLSSLTVTVDQERASAHFSSPSNDEDGSKLANLAGLRATVVNLLRDNDLRGRVFGVKIIVNLSQRSSALYALAQHEGLLTAVSEMLVGEGKSVIESIHAASAMRALCKLGSSSVSKIGDICGVVERLLALLKGGGTEIKLAEAVGENGDGNGHDVGKGGHVVGAADLDAMGGVQDHECHQEVVDSEEELQELQGSGMSLEDCICIGLGALYEIACDENGCEAIGRVRSHMRELVWYALGNSGQLAAEASLCTIRRLMERRVQSGLLLVETEGGLESLERALKEGNSRQVGEVMSVLGNLSKGRGELKSTVACHQGICDTLVSFVDDRHIVMKKGDRDVYIARRALALEVILDLSSTEARFRSRLAARRDAPEIIARVICTAEGKARECALRLAEVAGEAKVQVPVKVGMKEGVITLLAGAIAEHFSVNPSAAFASKEKILTLSLLTRMAGDGELCRSIGSTPQLLATLIRLADKVAAVEMKSQAGGNRQKDGAQDSEGAHDKIRGGVEGADPSVLAAEGEDARNEEGLCGEDIEMVGKEAAGGVNASDAKAEQSILGGQSLNVDVRIDQGRIPQKHWSRDQEASPIDQVPDAVEHLIGNGATLLLRALVADSSNALNLLKTPFHSLGTILKQISSENQNLRTVGLSMLWSVSVEPLGRQLLSPNANTIIETLSRLLSTQNGHEEHALLVLSVLVQDDDVKIAMMRDDQLVQKAIALIFKEQDASGFCAGEKDIKELRGDLHAVNVAAVRLMESFARGSTHVKQFLGGIDTLTRGLLKLQQEGGHGDEQRRAAGLVIEELCLDCDENDGLFVRLRAAAKENLDK